MTLRHQQKPPVKNLLEEDHKQILREVGFNVFDLFFHGVCSFQQQVKNPTCFPCRKSSGIPTTAWMQGSSNHLIWFIGGITPILLTFTRGAKWSFFFHSSAGRSLRVCPNIWCVVKAKQPGTHFIAPVIAPAKKATAWKFGKPSWTRWPDVETNVLVCFMSDSIPVLWPTKTNIKMAPNRVWLSCVHPFWLQDIKLRHKECLTIWPPHYIKTSPICLGFENPLTWPTGMVVSMNSFNSPGKNPTSFWLHLIEPTCPPSSKRWHCQPFPLRPNLWLLDAFALHQ